MFWKGRLITLKQPKLYDSAINDYVVDTKNDRWDSDFGNDNISFIAFNTYIFSQRRKFKEKYSYDLPNYLEWDNLYGNFNDFAFIEFNKFKDESTSCSYTG